MHKIDRIAIEGLWGRSDASLRLHPDVTLLLGENGTGKTTVINLVSAALTVDFPALLKTEFSSIEIVFRPWRGHAKPSVSVRKLYDRERGILRLEWSIRESQSSTPVVFTIEDVPERAFMQSTRRRMYQTLAFDVEALQQRLNLLFKITWLSILRGEQRLSADREDAGISPVDSKLHDLSVELGQYFAELKARADLETDQFQETLFLSLLADEIAAHPRVGDTDLDDEKRQLEEIYRQLRVPRAKYERRLDKHFENVQRALPKVGTTMPWEDGSVLILNERTHQIVRKWNDVKTAQSDIFLPREAFLGVLNDLMKPKKFGITAKNELVAKSADGRELRLHDLSSGEKQMLIILGEALLQRSGSTIYIADEPELSLHISWQERLIDNVRLLNPEAQILFATHSPDIVSRYQDHAYAMVKVLR